MKIIKIAKAFAPANVSCVFRLYESNNPEKKGSLGMGFTLDKGAIISARRANKTIVKVNGKKIEFPTVMSVLKKLTKEKIEVNIKNDVPFGAGFGMSGASALATAYAVNKLLGLKKSKKQLALSPALFIILILFLFLSTFFVLISPNTL